MSFDAFDICASALYANRVKIDTIASNIANANTTRQADGTVGPYKRKQVVFKALYKDEINDQASSRLFLKDKTSNSNPNVLTGGIRFDDNNVASGVKVEEIVEDNNTPLRKVYDPSHPDSDEEGYVSFPNVNNVKEMINLMSANKHYEAAVTVADATKNMMASAMRI